jgi:hypothetical protein
MLSALCRHVHGASFPANTPYIIKHNNFKDITGLYIDNGNKKSPGAIPAVMAQTKDKHYWSQLRVALTAGSWGSPHPAKAFKGGPISWTDLLRKFKKHCHGYSDVSEIANQTQALALLVAGGPTDRELDGIGYHHEELLVLGTESVVADEHAAEAELGYKILRDLEAENTISDVRLPLAIPSRVIDVHNHLSR